MDSNLGADLKLASNLQGSNFALWNVGPQSQKDAFHRASNNYSPEEEMVHEKIVFYLNANKLARTKCKKKETPG